MEQKINPEHLTSPMDSWKSSNTPTRKSNVPPGAPSYANAYQDQLSTFESEGNVPQLHKVRQQIKSLSHYTNQGVVEAKKVVHQGSEWIKRNPVLAIGIGLGIGFLLGRQVKSRIDV